MQRRHFFVLAAALAAAPLLAGCGPKWIVLTQAAPNPLLNQTKFGLMPVEYTGLIVGEKSEAEYLASKDDETRASWAGDKSGIDTEFGKRLSEKSTEFGVTVVKAQVKKLRAAGSPEVAFRVAVKDGKVNFVARALKGGSVKDGEDA